MNLRQLVGLLTLTLLSGCLSKSEPLQEHFFTLPLPKLEGLAVPGERPLRFDRVSSPPLLSNQMVWRVGKTELMLDDLNAWALHPAEVLEQRLRDLLFSREGFRESLSGHDPLLSVRVVSIEGEGGAPPEGNARIELVADYFTSDGLQHRERFVELEPLPSLDPVGLSHAMGAAMDRSTSRLVAWVVARE